MQADRIGKESMAKKLTIIVPDEIHRKLKIKAAMESTSITKIIIDMVKKM